MMGRMTGNGESYGGGPATNGRAGNGNVVPLRPRTPQPQQPPPPAPQNNEPAINLPPATKGMILILLGIQAALALLVPPPERQWLFDHFGFRPSWYTVSFPGWPALAGPLTYTLLHGGWMHAGMNAGMIAAFGSGVEKWMGAARMLILFVLCSLAAALCQLALSPFSDNVVIGASGGISGLFAASVIMLARRGMMRSGILPFALIWIGVSVLFGLLGAPDGSAIAWAAHIGGFVAGLALVKPVMKIRIGH